MKKKKINFHQLFNNNRFIIIFSIVLAFAVWVSVSMTAGSDIEKTIRNVPVDLNVAKDSVPARFGLQVFGEDKYFVNVTVKGKSYVVSKLTAEDIKVTAQTKYVSASGKQELNLMAEPTEKERTDFTIQSLSEESIQVYFDTYKEAEYTLISEIKAEKGVIPSDEYIQEPEILSANTVKISGPTTEMNKIKTVVAHIQLKDPITATQTFDAQVIPRGEYDSTLQYLKINDGNGNGNGNITITIPVLKVKTLPVTVNFTNAPSYFIDNPLPFTCSPSSVRIAAAESEIDKMNSVSAGTIDFSKLGALKNQFIFDADSLRNVVVMDDTAKFKITVDASGMASAEYNVPKENVSLTNIPSGWKATVVQAGISNVAIVGSSDNLSGLQDGEIFAEVNFANLPLTEGTVKLPAKVYVKGKGNIWAYGNYNVFVSLSKS